MKDQIRKWLVEQVGEEDQTLLETIYADYVSTVGEQLTKAEVEIARGDFAALDVTAHTLKGSTSTVGDTETYDAVMALRDAAKASDSAAAQTALSRLLELTAQM